jgi:hypothetical protein
LKNQGLRCRQFRHGVHGALLQFNGLGLAFRPKIEGHMIVPADGFHGGPGGHGAGRKTAAGHDPLADHHELI